MEYEVYNIVSLNVVYVGSLGECESFKEKENKRKGMTVFDVRIRR